LLSDRYLHTSNAERNQLNNCFQSLQPASYTLLPRISGWVKLYQPAIKNSY
jgi:hypothetical protein